MKALARLRFSETVAQSDVDEALRLMHMSKYSLYSEDMQKSGLDSISDIYSILREEAGRRNSTDVRYADALNWISRKVKPTQFDCLCSFLVCVEEDDVLAHMVFEVLACGLHGTGLQ